MFSELPSRGIDDRSTDGDSDDIEDHPYRLERLTTSIWKLVDRSVPAGDDSGVLAFIEEVDEAGVSVSWLQPVPLATRYMSAEMVLTDLVLWCRRRNAAEPPLPIPHLPPTGPQTTVGPPHRPRAGRRRG
jgi:hypothetical protein